MLQSAKIPGKVSPFREAYRTTRVGANYRGWVHMAFTTLTSLFLIVFSFQLLENPSWWEWALVPFFLFLTNLGEYWGHRGPLHHRTRFLRPVFQRHTLEHHQFFTYESPFFETQRDYKIVLFPPVLILFFLFVLAAPLSFVVSLVLSKNAAILFFISVFIHFLTYEWMHLYFHSPKGSFLDFLNRWTMLRFLREHHRIHHDLRGMTEKNFNLTLPVTDFLAGTLETAKTKNRKTGGS